MIEHTWLTILCASVVAITMSGLFVAFIVWKAHQAGSHLFIDQMMRIITDDRMHRRISVMDLSRVRAVASEDGSVYILVFEDGYPVLMKCEQGGTPRVVSMDRGALPRRIALWSYHLTMKWMYQNGYRRPGVTGQQAVAQRRRDGTDQLHGNTEARPSEPVDSADDGR